MQDTERIAILILKHLGQVLTDEEREELEGWVSKSEVNQKFFEEMSDPKNVGEELKAYAKSPKLSFEKLLERIRKNEI